MKCYLITSKPTDYSESNQMVIKAKLSEIKNKVYHYIEIPEEHYEILKLYLGDFYEYYEESDLEDYFG